MRRNTVRLMEKSEGRRNTVSRNVREIELER